MTQNVQARTQCKSVQCTVTSVRNGRAASGGSARPDKGKGGKGGKGKAKKGGKGKEKDEKPAGKFEGECRYYQNKGHQKAECRKMKADLAANATRTASQQVSTRPRLQARRSLPRTRAMHRVQLVQWRLPSRCSTWSLCTPRITLAVRRFSTPKPGSSTLPAQRTLMVASLDGA